MKPRYGFGVVPRRRSNTSRVIRRVLGLNVSGHDAGAAIVEDGRVLEVIEFERIFAEKRYRVFPDSRRFDRCLGWLFETYHLDPCFDLVAIQTSYFGQQAYAVAVSKLKKYISAARFILLNHHLCHAASAYFTSPFRQTCILSYDGWGNDGATIGFLGKDGSLSYCRSWPYRMGSAYRTLGSLIGDIREFDGHTAGKTMGLTSYGNLIESWKAPIRRFIKSYVPIRYPIAPWEPSIADGALELPGFGPITGANCLGGPLVPAAQDFAHTFQVCWTEVVLEVLRELVSETNLADVCIVGGAALNAITNHEILNMPEVKRVHFIPNPSDSGIAMGAALYAYYCFQRISRKGANAHLSPYLGLPVLDERELLSFAKVRAARSLIDPFPILAEMLASGKIVGVIQGRSEIGPRALGNRSILCDPRRLDLKNKLNQEIKRREWYRPYAPVVLEEEREEYFDCPSPVPYMSIIAFTRRDWVERLPAVTHIDGSVRLQTVTQDQHPFLHQLLIQFKKLTGVGVLLNTSFNTQRQPIITTIRDALRLLDETGLDAVYSEGWLFEKCNEHRC